MLLPAQNCLTNIPQSVPTVEDLNKLYFDNPTGDSAGQLIVDFMIHQETIIAEQETTIANQETTIAELRDTTGLPVS